MIRLRKVRGQKPGVRGPGVRVRGQEPGLGVGGGDGGEEEHSIFIVSVLRY